MNKFNEFEKAYCDIINENKVIEESNNIANEEDKYTNFTGTIEFGKNNGIVKNATFELRDGKIYWENGIWCSGTWDDGIWNDGTFKEGEWNNGLWDNGTWEHGIWEDGIWVDGIWKNGFWSFGEWRNGTWKNGTWEGGDWLGGEWYQGKIYDEHSNQFVVEYNAPYSSAF